MGTKYSQLKRVANDLEILNICRGVKELVEQKPSREAGKADRVDEVKMVKRVLF